MEQIPTEILNTRIQDLQLNVLTIVIAVQILGRAYAGLKHGGGLVGLYRGIVFGTNTQKPEEK